MADFRHGDGDVPQTPSDTPSHLPRRRTPWNTLGGRVISLVSRKGGVGKTTSTVNLGAALALSGHTVLVVGVDSQCGVCRTLGAKPFELPVCLTDIFDKEAHLTDLAQKSPLENLMYVSPRILSLKQEERYLKAMEARAVDFVREIDRARCLYDTILIDCPPSLGPATLTALLASDSYLVPVQAEELCRESLDSLLDFVDTFRERNFDTSAVDPASTPLALEGLFLTMANANTRMGRHVAARVTEDFSGFLFGTSIPRTVRLSEMSLRGKPAVIYDRRSPGSRAYFDLADELVSHYAAVSEPHWEAVPHPPAAVPAGEKARDGVAQGHQEKFVSGGLEKFLADLSRRAAGGGDLADADSGPEMVSLDELLAEEENRDGEDSDEDFWSRDRNPDRWN